MSAFHNNMLLGSAKTADLGDPIEQSLRFSGDQRIASSSNVPTGDYTLSLWVKRADDATGSGMNTLFTGSPNQGYQFGNFQQTPTSCAVYSRNNTTSNVISNGSLRDYSAWYHCVFVSSSGTTTLYLNGVQQGSHTTPASGNTVTIGSNYSNQQDDALKGYLAEYYCIDGQALAPTTFGRFNADGVWVPKTPTISSYGTNGFHLTFDSSQTNGIGHDSSGQGNHFTVTGFETTAISSTNFDNDIDYNDTPTSNYPTLNPLAPGNTSALGEGNLMQGINSNASGCSTTIEIPNDGVYYWEVEQVIAGAAPGVSSGSWYTLMGLFPKQSTSTDRQYYGEYYYTNCFGINFYSVSYNNFGIIDATYSYADGTMFSTASPANSVFGILVDRPNNRIKVFRNGVQWTPSDTSSTISNGWLTFNDSSNELTWELNTKSVASGQLKWNFGQRPFIYTIPTGAKALQSNNLPEPTIKDGSDHFRAIAAGPDTGVGAGELGGNWSTFLTPASGSWLASAGYDATGAFEGNAGNGAFPSACPSGTGPTGSLMTFAPDTDVAFTTLEVYMPNAQQNAKFDGTVTAVTNSSWTQVATNGTINKTTPLEMYANAGVYAYCQGIRINGNQILVDSGPLAAAQAAFPSGLWWIKDRDNTNDHQLVDSVRGGNLALACPSTAGQSAYSPPSNTSTGCIAWCWKTDSSAASNNQGSIATSVSANTDAGFSILTYTATGTAGTLGHGLTKPPELIISKRSDGTAAWAVYHSAAGNGQRGRLNTSDAFASEIVWNSTDPTNTVYSIGAGPSDVNTLNESMVSYCWHSVPGYSAFGSYEGNSSTDGPFVYTGFRPAFVLIKSTSGYNWTIVDSTRNPDNPVDTYLFPNQTLSDDTYSTYNLDFVSNGFKLRNSAATDTNYTGNTYIYAAFAENPFGGQNTAPVPAR